MAPRFPLSEVEEGKARLLIPTLDHSTDEPTQKLRMKAPVFYNPIQATNRDTAVLASKVQARRLKRSIRVCEPMCGSGVRGIRLALEVDEIESVVMSDLSPSAIQLSHENAERNGVRDKVRLRLLDSNLLLSLHGYPGGRFDYVDIDPYGSPVSYMDSAIRATVNHGLIALTATDMAPLCGVNSQACLRKYGGYPLHNEFCHETALRLLASAIVNHAAVYESAATPVFSYYADHYVRLYVVLDSGARKTDELLKKIGYIKYCPKCLTRIESGDCSKDKCDVCGNPLNVGGPMWLGELAEAGFLEDMLTATDETGLNNSRAASILNLVRGEIGFPVSYYVIDSICSLAKVKSIHTGEFIKILTESGYRVTMTHYSDRAIKTEATADEMKKILMN